MIRRAHRVPSLLRCWITALSAFLFQAIFETELWAFQLATYHDTSEHQVGKLELEHVVELREETRNLACLPDQECLCVVDWQL